MGQGLVVYDELGRVVLDTSDRISRVNTLLTISITATNGSSYSFPNIYSGKNTPIAFIVNAGDLATQQYGGYPLSPYKVTFDYPNSGKDLIVNFDTNNQNVNVNKTLYVMCVEY